MVHKPSLFLMTNLCSILSQSQISLMNQRRVLHSPSTINTWQMSSIVLCQILEPQEYLQQENLKFKPFNNLIPLSRLTNQRQVNIQFILARVPQSLSAQLGSKPP